MNNLKTKNLTLLSLFIAIEILLATVPFLGFIPIGPLRATTLHIPVIIAGIVLGKKKGAIIGFVFGLCSLIASTVSPGASSFVFSPFISGSFLSAIVAIVPRMAIGYVAGIIYELLKDKNTVIAMTIASFLGAISNTILVMGGIYFFFGTSYAKILGISIEGLLLYIIGIITTQGLLEAIVGTIIAVLVCKVLVKVYH